jgi:hypothetical protein
VLQTGLTEHVDQRLVTALGDIAPSSPITQAAGVGDYPQLNTTNWRGAVTLTAASWPGVLAAAERNGGGSGPPKKPPAWGTSRR